MPQSGSWERGKRAYLVADAHLVADARLAAGARSAAADRAMEASSTVGDSLVEFFARVPEPGDELVLLGDIFDFWIDYGSVIPRYAFPVLAALHNAVRRGIRLIVVGGNHDRWGPRFWKQELKSAFYPGEAVLELCGWRAYLNHGDNVVDPHAGARILHLLARRPWAARLFRLLHPDVGLALVNRFSQDIARFTRDAALLERAARAQSEFAQRLLRDRPDLDLVAMAHTHRAVLNQVAPGRWYLNPGAWMLDRSYAVLTAEGPELRHFE